MIEWIENGELRNDAPEPSLKRKILKVLVIVVFFAAGPTFWRLVLDG